jgi:excisionase family DNA binding protein
MTTRRHIGARTGSGNGADDDLTRLVRLIARQAAQEAFAVFKDALETSIAQAKAASDAHAQEEAAAQVTADKALRSPESGERFLCVAEVAARLDVSEKTVRRKVALGELPGHRVGKLLRIGERGLAACMARTRLATGRRK